MIPFYLLLTLFTCIIGYLLFRIIKRTQDWSFALGIFFLYYWSLLGAWFFVYDDKTNGGGIEWGLHYHRLFKELFIVRANTDYLLTIFAYGIFIITIELTILKFTKQKNLFKNVTVEKIKVNHGLLIILCIICSLISLSLVWKQILIAAKYEESVYYITRHYPVPTFTIHQLLNQISIVALYIGLITLLTGEKGKYFSGSNNRKMIIWYILAVVIVEGGLLFLGNKREILFAGIFGFIYYLNTINYKIDWKHLGIFIIVIGFPLFFNDALRAFSPTFLTKYFDVSDLYFTPPEVNYTEFSVSNAASAFLFSNEMFAGHFSMYGAIHKEIPLTYGSSIKSLIASGIPKFIYPDRPMPVYDYYVEQVGANKTMGFTIHHATGWFINFGWLGILVGGAIIGWIWSYLYNGFNELYKFKNKILRLFFTIGMGAFVAFLPSLIRTGPEGYKALLFEALILPSLIVLVSSDVFKNKKGG